MSGRTTKQRDPHLFATVMLVVLTMVWGLTFPATKAALEVTDPIQFLALRFCIGFVLLFLILRLIPRFINKSKGSSTPDPTLSAPMVEPREQGTSHLASFWITFRRQVVPSATLRGIIVGMLLFTGFVLQVQGMKLTTASRSGFFTGLLVVLVPPLAMLMRTSRAPLASWVALLPAIAGVYLLADPTGGGLNGGDWLTIGCAFAFALQMVILEALSRHEGEAGVLTLAQVGTIAVLASIWGFIQGHPFVMSGTGVLSVLYTGIFGTVVAVWMQTRFQPDVPAGHAALIFQLEPVFAASFATLLLGDSWTVRALFGAGLILAASSLSSIGLIRQSMKRGGARKG